MSSQKTYCVNSDCPFRKCDKHLWQLKKAKDKSGYVKVASLDSVCKDYLQYLLDLISKEKNYEQRNY